MEHVTLPKRQNLGYEVETRRSLLERMKNWSEQESWNQFFELYWRLIYRTALRYGLTETEAQDVVQETVISVAKSISGFTYDPTRGSFKGWLLTIVRCRAIDQKKKRLPAREISTAFQEHSIRDFEFGGHCKTHDDFEKIWDSEWCKYSLQLAIDGLKLKLKPQHFRIAYLTWVEAKSASEISQALGISLGVVYLVRFRAKGLIAKGLKKIEETGGLDPRRAR